MDKKTGTDISLSTWIPYNTNWKSIVHLAAASSIYSSWEDCVTDNIIATYNVIKHCPIDAKIIFASSCAASHTALHWYGRSKAICEDMIKDSGLTYTIFRFYNVAGGKDVNGHIIPRAIHAAKTEEPLYIFGDSVRDYVSIFDVIERIKEAVNGNYNNEIVDVGTGIGTCTSDIINKVEELTGKIIKKVYCGKNPIEDDVLVCPVIDNRYNTDLDSIIRSAL